MQIWSDPHLIEMRFKADFFFLQMQISKSDAFISIACRAIHEHDQTLISDLHIYRKLQTESSIKCVIQKKKKKKKCVLPADVISAPLTCWIIAVVI